MVWGTGESTACLDCSRQKKRCRLKRGARGTAAPAHPQKAAPAADAAQKKEGRRPGTCTYSQSCCGWSRVNGISAKCFEVLRSKVT